MKWLKILFGLMAGVNLVGALSPELSFDALWYHLPLARFIAERGEWGVVPGGLLYMSGMPRFLDWVYGGLLWVGQGLEAPETLVKLLHYALGVGSGLIVARMGSWPAAVLWYATPLVGWQSISAYVDLGRTFLILVAVWFVTKKRPYRSAIAVGLAYSVKMLSGIEGLILAIVWGWRRGGKEGVKYAAAVVPFVFFWGGFNISQGYPFWYPLGEFGVVSEHWGWDYLTGPMIGEGRYILPELAILSIWLSKKKSVSKLIVAGALIQGVVGIGYRGVANLKFVPYLLGQETKSEFLTRHLDFEFADWYDTDGWLRANLSDKRYLVKGVHNTYYLPGSNWEHESWSGGECFEYTLVQGDGAVEVEWKLIHEIKETRTRVYETSCL